MSNVTRPSSSSNYDERFVVPLEASRRGAHRARVNPVMAALPVVVVAGIVLGAIFLVYTLFGGLGGGSDAGSDATTTTSPASTASSTEASPTPTESGSGAPSGSPSGSGAAAGQVDKTVTVDIYNGTKPLVSGLARKVAPKITNAGWTTGHIETWTGSPVTVTTIYYGTSDQKATAQALAKAIGRGSVKLSPSKAGDAGRIAVVVGNDYPGAGRSTKNSGSTRSSTATRTSSAATTKTSGTTRSQTATETDGGDGGDASPSPTS